MTEIGQRIRHERIMAGLTQDQLGAAIGFTAPKVCRIERGYETPNDYALISIAQALGVTVELLKTPISRRVSYITLKSKREQDKRKRMVNGDAGA